MTKVSSSSIIRVTLSGSFRRDTEGLERVYRELALNQCQILSPRTLDFSDTSVLFVRNQVEGRDEVKTIQDHHLQAIALSHFLWVHISKGYVGTSTAMEIGFAYANNIPIYATEAPIDEMLKQYVQVVGSVFRAIEHLPS